MCITCQITASRPAALTPRLLAAEELTRLPDPSQDIARGRPGRHHVTVGGGHGRDRAKGSPTKGKTNPPDHVTVFLLRRVLEPGPDAVANK